MAAGRVPPWLENGRRRRGGYRLPPLPSIDRRRPDPSVAELRRQLRESDRQRFELEAALSGAARGWLDGQEAHVRPPAGAPPRPAGAWWKRGWHLPAAAAFLTVGVCGAFVEWAQRRESPFPPAASAHVTVESRRVRARVVQDNPVETVSSPLPQAVALAARPAPRLRAQRQFGSRSQSVKPRASEPAPPPVLHPLSPGEFGRRPWRRAG
jgi:hypothetical protein